MRIAQFYATSRRIQKDSLNTLVECFLSKQPSTTDFINFSFYMCILKYYDRNYWSFFQGTHSEVSLGLHQTLRIITYALETEAKDVLQTKLLNGAKLTD